MPRRYLTRNMRRTRFAAITETVSRALPSAALRSTRAGSGTTASSVRNLTADRSGATAVPGGTAAPKRKPVPPRRSPCGSGVDRSPRTCAATPGASSRSPRQGWGGAGPVRAGACGSTNRDRRGRPHGRHVSRCLSSSDERALQAVARRLGIGAGEVLPGGGRDLVAREVAAAVGVESRPHRQEQLPPSMRGHRFNLAKSQASTNRALYAVASTTSRLRCSSEHSPAHRHARRTRASVQRDPTSTTRLHRNCRAVPTVPLAAVGPVVSGQ